MVLPFHATIEAKMRNGSRRQIFRLPPEPVNTCDGSFISGDRAVTPVWSATPAVRANAETTDQRPGTSPDATRRGSSGDCSGRQLLLSVEDLHGKRQIASVEFRQVLINQQGVYRFHHLLAFALDGSKYT